MQKLIFSQFKVQDQRAGGFGAGDAVLLMAAFSLCPHATEEGEALVSLPLLLSHHGGPTLMSSSKFSYLPQALQPL